MPGGKWRGNWEEFGELSDQDRCLTPMKESGEEKEEVWWKCLQRLGSFKEGSARLSGSPQPKSRVRGVPCLLGGSASVSLLCSVPGWSNPWGAWPPPQLSDGLQSVVAEAQSQAHSLESES